MKSRCAFRSLSLLLLLVSVAIPAQADSLIIVRTQQPIPVALESLKQAIREQGYSVARVDMVNIGLLGMGYTSNNYRAVFFGRADEIRQLSLSHPQLIPYMPPRIAVFSEGESTLLVAVNPSTYLEFLSGEAPVEMFNRWEKDIEEMFSRMAAQTR